MVENVLRSKREKSTPPYNRKGKMMDGEVLKRRDRREEGTHRGKDSPSFRMTKDIYSDQ